MTTSDRHTTALRLVHEEAGRTLSRDDFDLCMRIAKRALGAPDVERTLPQNLTPPLRRVLGMMLWETTPIAHAMRAAGRDIARKVEDEQAVVLHWLLGIVLEHGADWGKHAAIELRKLTDGMGKQNV